MRNGFNQFSVPYMNELTANQFNAASVFGGNMPLGFVNYSMDVINSFFQNPSAPQTGRPEDFEEVIINGRKVLRRKTTQLGTILGLPSATPGLPQTPTTPPIAGGTNPAAKQCPPGEVPYNPTLAPWLTLCGKQMQSDPTPEEKEKAGIGSDLFGGFELLNTKVVIILVGLVLLIAAVVSLR